MTAASAREPMASRAPAPRALAQHGPGVAVSAFVHLVLLFLIFFTLRTVTERPAFSRFLPVDIVPLGEETQSPPSPDRSLVPQQSAATHPPNAVKPEGYAPDRTKPLPDDLETKLKSLGKLRQPDSALAPVDNGGVDNATASSDAANGEASYSVKDYIRAQILRRWMIDFSTLGTRNFTVRLHVAMTATGRVTVSELVDTRRAATDKAYREVALSARNAVTLSSPFTLPEGRFPHGLDVTLDLDPRSTLR